MILLADVAGSLGRSLASHYKAKGEALLLAGSGSVSGLDEALYPSENFCPIDCGPVEAGTRLRSFLATRIVTTLEAAILVPPEWREAGAEAPPAERLVEQGLTRIMAVAHAALPSLIESRGKLIVFCPRFGTFSGPEAAIVEGTHAGLREFVRNLRVELSGTGVRVKMVLRGEVPFEQGLDGTSWTAFRTDALVRAIDSKKPDFVIGGKGDSRNSRREPSGNGNGRAAAPPASGKAQRRCVITGAGGGIGRCLVQAYHARGFAVTGIDVDERAWEGALTEKRIGKPPPAFVAADLADRQSLDATLDQLHEAGPIDIFVHNAGLNEVGPFRDFDLERLEAITAINFTAPVQLTEALIDRDMLTADACLVFMGSLSSAVGYPGAIPYAASKGALTAYAAARREALAARGVHVLTVHPGPTRTAMAERCSPVNTARARARRMAPEHVASAILRAVEIRRRVLYPGLKTQVSAAAGRWFPRLTEYAMRKAVFERLPIPSRPDR